MGGHTVTQIGFVILGAAGDRGAAALEILPRLCAAERDRGINVELVCLAEADQASFRDLAAKASSLLGSSCPVVSVLAEAIPYALRWLAHGTAPRKLVIYDATPTAQHYLHLMAVLPHSQRQPIFYFGEKPLFTNSGQVQFIENNFARETFFCEFIETENPAFRAARDFLRSEPFSLQRMFFWRASCMGVSIAAGDGRGGVEGGALLDKAPHDLSVALGLLEPQSLQSAKVRGVDIQTLALHPSRLDNAHPRFLSLANTPIANINSPASIPEFWPACGALSFDVDFTLTNGYCAPASFIASWLGLQDTPAELSLSHKLSILGLDSQDWLNTESSCQSQDGRYHYQNQEVRLALLEGNLAERKAHLFVNLLSKFGGRRSVCLVDKAGHHQTIFEEPPGADYHQQKDGDLLRIFQNVIEHCAGQGVAENIGPQATLAVHKIVLSVLDKVNQQFPGMNQGEADAASLRAYEKYLRLASPA